MTRLGPRGAWWVNLRPRAHDGIGISLEVPTGRARAWNVAYVGLVAGCIWWARSTGNGWGQIGGAIACAVALGGGFLAYVITVATPRALRRHEASCLARVEARRAAEVAEECLSTTSEAAEPDLGVAA